jgi:hypothetical protein
VTRTAFLDLPAGFAIDGPLDLRYSCRFTGFPPGLRIGGWLNLEGCEGWNGEIPEDMIIAGKIYTDAFPVTNAGAGGITLAEWRKRKEG